MQARALRARVAFYFDRSEGRRPPGAAERWIRPDRDFARLTVERTAHEPWLRDFQLALKRGFDVTSALAGLLVLAPLLIAVALLIRIGSPGPVLFRQHRTGLDNQSFEILKFRTMYVDSCDPSGVAQTTSDDPRVTPIGHILRSTNIDELPQLINVLKGDMSLIGPRPHVPGMIAAGMLYEELVEDYPQRHLMRPGITGLAQANGLRGPTVQPEPAVLRVALDLEYIRNFSLWLDFRILIWTVFQELREGNGF